MCVCGLGDHTHQGVHPPPIKACPPNPKFFGSHLNLPFCPSPLTATFPRALRTISHYLYNIFVHRIRFYWIGEQYTSLCCWLIQMYIQRPFSLLSLEWTALLTVAWFAVSYRIRCEDYHFQVSEKIENSRGKNWKQAGAVLGQAQLKLGFDFTSIQLFQ